MGIVLVIRRHGRIASYVAGRALSLY